MASIGENNWRLLEEIVGIVSKNSLRKDGLLIMSTMIESEEVEQVQLRTHHHRQLIPRSSL